MKKLRDPIVIFSPATYDDLRALKNAFQRCKVNLQEVYQRTGYLLANPSKFSERSYELDIRRLSYPELSWLNDSIQFIRDVAIYNMGLQELDRLDLPERATLIASAGGSAALLAGGGVGGATYFMTASNAAKICKIAAKALGIAGLSGVVVAVMVTHIALYQSEAREEGFRDRSSNIATRMHQVVQKKQIERQGCAMVAHLQLSAQQQGEIAALRAENANIIADSATMRIENNSLRGDTAALQRQMARVLNLLEPPAPQPGL